MNSKKVLQAGFFAACLFVAGTIHASAAALPHKLVPVGVAAGINLETQGVLIVGFAQESAARDAGFLEGDSILSINGTEIDNAAELSGALSASEGEVTVLIQRAGTQITLKANPDRSGDTPKLGVFVRDAMAGIGTVTYYNPETGAYGALGHGISESGTGALMPASGGKLVSCTLDAITPGSRGTPGELSGKIDPSRVLGSIEANTPFGIFGHLDTPWEGQAIETACTGDIRPGPAKILSGVSGQLCEYAIKICAVYHGTDSGRDMLIEVTDPHLIDLTGGIVRGMSGSPILQNGKLVGAVTHVLVNEPLKGYAISIENMLAAEKNSVDSVEDAA